MEFKDLIRETSYDISPLIQQRFAEIRKAIDEGVEEQAKRYMEYLGWIRPENVQRLREAYNELQERVHTRGDDIIQEILAI